MAKRGTILGAFDIRYLSRTAIKRQVLADLVAEFTEGAESGGNKELDKAGRGMITIAASSSSYWELYVDGALFVHLDPCTLRLSNLIN